MVARAVLDLMVKLHPAPLTTEDVTASLGLSEISARQSLQWMVRKGVAKSARTRPNSWSLAVPAEDALRIYSKRKNERKQSPITGWWPHEDRERGIWSAMKKEPLTGQWGAGFAAVGVGFDVTTGRPWAR